MDELIARIDQLIGAIEGIKAAKIKSPAFKQDAIELAKLYFQSSRDSLAQSISQDKLAPVDESWQQLIRLAHGRSPRASYEKCLTSLKKSMTELNILVISNPKRSSLQAHRFTASESVLIKTLEGLVPSAAASYIQGILDLASKDRVSYRGCAGEFREAFREILDHLAPDDDVMKAHGYTPERDRKTPTMKQKVRFILKSRGMNQTRSNVAEKSLELIESLHGDIARAIYDRASIATHLETTRDEVFQLKRYVDTILFDLLAIQK
jgi:hypothetical protein